MKKIYCLLILLAATMGVFAQKAEPGSKLQDKKEIEGMTVQLTAAKGNTYLFEITKHGLPLDIPMRNNPVTMLPGGFTSKDDAYKVAEWMIRQYKKTGHFPTVVPMHIARELNISTDKLYQQP